ncbi:MAG TPA: hypothetical protein VFV40_03370, partial [Nocardioides sp.]|nr:hypothetical protein [Nocardioides sp.]
RMGKRRDEPDEPTLELPSFFRRRKRRDDGSESSETTVDTSAEQAPEVEEPVVDRTTEADVPAAPEPAPATPEPAEPATPEPAEPATPEPAEPAAPEPATPEPALAEPATPAETPPPPEPAAEPAAEPAGEPAPAPAPARRRAARPDRTPRTLPALSPGAASLVVGALVGLVGTALTWAALQGCEALRGTDSCGGPGLLVLVAILVLMVLAGTLLLKALRVSEPNATSFLGVGLMTVIVLVTLMENLFSAWMFLAVPVLTALSYLAAQWVSTRFVDTEEPSPGVDVR